jgi:hypothetical protein
MLTVIQSKIFCLLENRVLKRIFEPKREVDGSWRKLYNDELHNLYSSMSIVRVIKSRRLIWVGHMAHMGEGEVFTRFWLGNPKRPLGKPRHRWEDKGIDGVNWIWLVQDRVQWQAFVNMVVNLQVP